MSIVAYSIKKVENAQDFESANIKLLQKAEKKHHEILVDVYNWILSHRGHLANLMVISDFAHTYLRYDTFKDLGENVLLAFPDDTIGCPWPLGIPSSVWLWSSLSSGGSPLDIQQIGTAQVGSTFLLRDLGKKGTTLKNQIEIPQVGRSTSPLRDCTTTEQKKLGKKEKTLKNQIEIPQVGTSLLRACKTKQKQRGKKRKSSEEESNHSITSRGNAEVEKKVPQL